MILSVLSFAIYTDDIKLTKYHIISNSLALQTDYFKVAV